MAYIFSYTQTLFLFSLCKVREEKIHGRHYAVDKHTLISSTKPSSFYSFDVLLFHFCRFLIYPPKKEKNMSKKQDHVKRTWIIFNQFSGDIRLLSKTSTWRVFWDFPLEVHGLWSASCVFLHGIRLSRSVRELKTWKIERFNGQLWRRWMCNKNIEIHNYIGIWLM